jgi:hypothetical protein
VADGDVPYTRGKATTGSAKHRARITAAQANGKNGTLRFPVGCSTLNPKGFYRQSRRGERVSLFEAHRIGNRATGPAGADFAAWICGKN